MNKQVDLREVRKKVKDVLESFDLPTKRFGVVIAVDEKDFSLLAEENPYLVHPDMLMFSFTDETGNQSYVQIQKLHMS